MGAYPKLVPNCSRLYVATKPIQTQPHTHTHTPLLGTILCRSVEFAEIVTIEQTTNPASHIEFIKHRHWHPAAF